MHKNKKRDHLVPYIQEYERIKNHDIDLYVTMIGKKEFG